MGVDKGVGLFVSLLSKNRAKLFHNTVNSPPPVNRESGTVQLLAEVSFRVVNFIHTTKGLQHCYLLFILLTTQTDVEASRRLVTS